MPPKSSPPADKRLPSARRKAMRNLDCDVQDLETKDFPADQPDQQEAISIGSPPSTIGGLEHAAIETTLQSTESAFNSDNTQRQVKLEKLDDRARPRGENWTEKEIPPLVQAGLGVNTDVRNGADNRLRYRSFSRYHYCCSS